MAHNADLILEKATVVTCDRSRPVIDGGSVAVRAGRIAAVGTATDLHDWTAERRVDLGRHALIPGLVNTHVHLGFTLTRGMFPELPLGPWLEQVFPVAERIDGDITRAAARLGCVEMLLGGTTAAIDHHYSVADRASTGIVLEAAEATGIRLGIGPTLSDVGAFSVDDETARRDVAALAAMETADRTRRSPWLALASPLRRETEDRCRLVMELAAEHGLRLTYHFAETRDWFDLLEEGSGRRLADLIIDLGLATSDAVMAHGVWFSGDEITDLAATGLHVAHSPVSNMYLGDGIAPLAGMLEAGMAVSLGTDAANCNNRLDMFEVMKTAALLAKVEALDPSVIAPATVMELATMGGARAMGLETEIGSIEVGKQADLVAIDLDRPHLTPTHDIVSNLVYCARAGDVDSVWIAGEPVVEDGRVTTVGVGDVLRDAGVATGRLTGDIALAAPGGEG